LRYRSDKRLNLDISAAAILIKIFLKHNNSNILHDIKLTLQLFANVVYGNREIFKADEPIVMKKQIATRK
jgi:hypothetical protein